MPHRRRGFAALIASALLMGGCAATQTATAPVAPVVAPPESPTEDMVAAAEPVAELPAAPEAIAPVANAPAMEGAALMLAPEAEAALAQAQLETANAAAVVAFYRLMFIEHRVGEAFDRYAGDRYVQHSPGLPDGREAVEAALTPYFEQNPLARSEILRVIAQGDFVALHVHAKSNPVDRGRAVVEIFRVEGGKIVEHWDVIQPIPEGAANENSMF